MAIRAIARSHHCRACITKNGRRGSWNAPALLVRSKCWNRVSMTRQRPNRARVLTACAARHRLSAVCGDPRQNQIKAATRAVGSRGAWSLGFERPSPTSSARRAAPLSSRRSSAPLDTFLSARHARIEARLSQAVAALSSSRAAAASIKPTARSSRASPVSFESSFNSLVKPHSLPRRSAAC